MKLRALILVFTAIFMTGCVNRQSVTVAPTTDMSALKTIYVLHQPKDKERIDTLIADNLRLRGVKASNGDGPAPSNVDAVITYVDKWMWDITMYLLQLTVTVRDPKTEFPMATASSYHSSLTRLPPVDMVAETINNIYNGKVTESAPLK
ncbi:hypothetical protein ICN18_06085 [Polynucleobacter sp. Ross1-W9]|uniref:hypothetical protein n=1 Tax=Polynucleobacter parvulilacunae TaxID=1855631 RepID=UPI001C0B6D55|nr:hypothetical protein [Polynucleobacter parvulilacunae]MBU3557195.1 hypothetical protein [Polynucleobacter parvulilacunae]